MMKFNERLKNDVIKKTRKTNEGERTRNKNDEGSIFIKEAWRKKETMKEAVKEGAV